MKSIKVTIDVYGENTETLVKELKDSLPEIIENIESRTDKGKAFPAGFASISVGDVGNATIEFRNLN